MTRYVDVKPVRTIMGRLGHGCDLLKELASVCLKEKIALGRVTAIGATQKAQIAFYDQFHKKYGFEEFDHPMEILQLAGNVSIKDGAPMVHAHVTLADDQGRAFGGHLSEGTVVFACEFVIEQFEGPELVRGHDEVTGLALWKMRA
jgi:predicted DNA-binding protein with PD1-like motif